LVWILSRTQIKIQL